MKPLAAAVVSLVLLAGCVGPANLPAVQYYVLGERQETASETALETASARRASQRSGVLLVQPTSVSAFYDTQRLVFSRAPGQRAYYQFAAWTDRPGRAFAELLRRRLEQRGAFAAVASTTAGVKGDLVLHTRLEELFHDASASPGTVKIEVSAELVDGSGRLLVESRRFSRSVPASGENAAAAVDAANRAVTAVLDDIAAWIEGSRPRPAAT